MVCIRGHCVNVVVHVFVASIAVYCCTLAINTCKMLSVSAAFCLIHVMINSENDLEQACKTLQQVAELCQIRYARNGFGM
jgi:hypothetical protein